MNGHVKIIDFESVIEMLPTIKNDKKEVPCTSIKLLSNFSTKTQ